MSLAWRVIKRSFSDFIDDILWLVVFNIVWCLAAVTVVALPLASAGLAWVAAEIGEGKVIGWRTFVEGVRRFWKQAYVWGLLNLVVGVLVVMNLVFYLGREESWATVPLMLFGALGLWWIGTQFYFFPFLVHQDPPALKTAYRNGLVLMLSQPLVSLTVFLVVAVLTAASYLLLFPMFLFYFVFLSLLANRAVIESIKAQREAEEAAAEREASSRPDRRWKP
jgi:uncharacterized membrane protein YesL